MGGPKVTPEFWRGRRVLLTGHSGFKGSWLTLLLSDLGAEVVGLSLEPPSDRPSLFHQAGVADHCHSIFGDVRDPRAVDEAFQLAHPSIVLHLAAQAIVRDSYADPVGTYSTNVMGTVQVLETIRKHASVEAAVVVTSDKCYENREWPWGYRENEAMGGHDPYSSSKGCAELVTSAYRRSFFSGPGAVAIGSARAGNVIGGGDYAKDRLIPDLLTAFQAGKPAIIRNPLATRPWQHVLEPLSGYTILAEFLATKGTVYAEGWNFGPNPDSVQPVRTVADKVVALWGQGAGWELDKGSQPHEAHSLVLDSSKARQALGWTPLLDLDEALEISVGWAKGLSSGAPAKSLCLAQIRDYVRRAGHDGSWPGRILGEPMGSGKA